MIVKSNFTWPIVPDFRHVFETACTNGCPPAPRVSSLNLVIGSNWITPFYVCPKCGAEYVEMDCVLQASALQRASELRSLTLRKGTTRDVEVEERLGVVLENAKSMTVLDRYAGVSLLRSRNGVQSGMEWLLGQAAARGIDDMVLITGFGSNLNSAVTTRVQVEREFRAAVTRARTAHGGPTSCRLTMYHDTVFKTHAHDRYLRVELNGKPITVALGKGVDSFSRPIIDQSYAFGLQINDVVDEFLVAVSTRPPSVVHV